MQEVNVAQEDARVYLALAKLEASSSALQLAQNHSDAMQLELRRTRLHLEEASEVAETRHRLNSELMQAKTELSELRQMCHQDQLWAMSLRQENEQLAADLRAASAYSESLSVELRGTGEKAQNSHEKCCELWVALETQRLETQRLQVALGNIQSAASVLERGLYVRAQPADDLRKMLNWTREAPTLAPTAPTPDPTKWTPAPTAPTPAPVAPTPAPAVFTPAPLKDLPVLRPERFDIARGEEGSESEELNRMFSFQPMASQDDRRPLSKSMDASRRNFMI